MSKVKIDISSEVYEVSPENVIVPENRQRKELNKERLADLAEDIKRLGQHTPGLCTQTENGLVLVFGFRRLSACSLNGMPFRYQLAEDLPPAELEVIELSENVMREGLTWQEEDRARVALHRKLVEIHGQAKAGNSTYRGLKRAGWSLSATADKIGVSKATLIQSQKRVSWMDRVPEVGRAKNPNEALRIIEQFQRKLDEEEKLKEAGLLKAKEGEWSAEKSPTIPGTVEELLNFSIPEENEELPDEDIKEPVLSPLATTLQKRIICGDSLELLEDFPDESIHLILTDPPWGVKIKSKAKWRGEFDDSEGTFEELIPRVAELLWRKMARNSHAYMFISVQNFVWVKELLEAQKFVVRDLPIIWCKPGSHYTRQASYDWGRSYESVIYFRKGIKVLQQQGRADHIAVPGMATAGKDIRTSHPSAKPPEIYKQFLLASAAPGDTVVDPFAGSCPLAKAAMEIEDSKRLDWFCFDLDEGFTNEAKAWILKRYEGIPRQQTIEPEEPLLPSIRDQFPSFRFIQPGSPEWRKWWDGADEGEQKEMLEFKNGVKNGWTKVAEMEDNEQPHSDIPEVEILENEINGIEPEIV